MKCRKGNGVEQWSFYYFQLWVCHNKFVCLFVCQAGRNAGFLFHRLFTVDRYSKAQPFVQVQPKLHLESQSGTYRVLDVLSEADHRKKLRLISSRAILTRESHASYQQQPDTMSVRQGGLSWSQVVILAAPYLSDGEVIPPAGFLPEAFA